MLATADPIATAERAQGLLLRDFPTAAVAILAVVCAALFGVLMTTIWRHGRIVNGLHEQSLEREEKFRAELENVRKEHLATLVEAQHAQMALLELKEELKVQLLETAAKLKPRGKAG